MYICTSKTEHIIIKRNAYEHWRKVKKVGSLLGDKENICRRNERASTALSKLSAIWLRSERMKQQIRLNIYNTLVKSILLYNNGTWALIKEEQHRLSFRHRHWDNTQRIVLGIRYPTIITKRSLGEKVTFIVFKHTSE